MIIIITFNAKTQSVFRALVKDVQEHTLLLGGASTVRPPISLFQPREDCLTAMTGNGLTVTLACGGDGPSLLSPKPPCVADPVIPLAYLPCPSPYQPHLSDTCPPVLGAPAQWPSQSFWDPATSSLTIIKDAAGTL